MRRRTARRRPAPTTPRRAGTLTLPARATSATISVGVLDDQIDDGGETLTLTLSNASRARPTDAVASGTINNTDPLPRALPARFGRAAAVHVVEQVEERLAARREPGLPARFAGRQLRRGVERDLGLDLLRQLGGLAGGGPFGAAPGGVRLPGAPAGAEPFGGGIGQQPAQSRRWSRRQSAA